MASTQLSALVLQRELSRLIGLHEQRSEYDAIIDKMGFSGTPENGYCLMYNGKRVEVSPLQLHYSLDDVSEIMKRQLFNT